MIRETVRESVNERARMAIKQLGAETGSTESFFPESNGRHGSERGIGREWPFGSLASARVGGADEWLHILGIPPDLQVQCQTVYTRECLYLLPHRTELFTWKTSVPRFFPGSHSYLLNTTCHALFGGTRF